MGRIKREDEGEEEYTVEKILDRRYDYQYYSTN